MDLIADIGGTSTRCGLLDAKGKLLAPEVLSNSEHAGVAEVLTSYLGRRRETDRPSRAALAIAAPITADRVKMINIAWEFSQTELKQRLQLTRLLVVNDFAALAWGVPRLGPGDVQQIGGGKPRTHSPLAVLGPGSGLGVATFVPSADGGTVLSGEGGHVTLPASTHEEATVIAMLRGQFGHCSAERALSGPGLINLHAALSGIAGRETSALTPAQITAAALKGDALARKTLDMFLALLGTVAGDVALTVGALGGVFIAGGIVPQIIGALEHSAFRERFEAKGRYRAYMQAIPTYVITNTLPAFTGLRRLLGYA